MLTHQEDLSVTVEDAVNQLLETRSARTPTALEIGDRGYEPGDPTNSTPQREAQKEYLNLAHPCAEFVHALEEADALDILAEHAQLEPAPIGGVFPYRIPPIPNAITGTDGFDLTQVTDVDQLAAASRLLLWLAASAEPEAFGMDWLFSQGILRLLPPVTERSGRVHPMRRVERWVHAAARAMTENVAARSNDGHTIVKHDGDAVDGVFTRQGDFWNVSFGAELGHVKDMDGMHYISRLLSRPGHSMSATQLRLESGKRDVIGQIGLELTDAEALEVYRKRLIKLRQERASAKASGNAERFLVLGEEEEQLERHIRAVSDVRGQPRRNGEKYRSSVNSVKQSIQRANKGIEKVGLSLLATHLKDALEDRDGQFSYRPDEPPPRWEL